MEVFHGGVQPDKGILQDRLRSVTVAPSRFSPPEKPGGVRSPMKANSLLRPEALLKECAEVVVPRARISASEAI